MLEHMLVAAIVLAACLYTLWTLAPNSLKLRLARAVRKRGLMSGNDTLVRLGTRLEGSVGGGCGSCEQHVPPQPSERKTPP